MTVRRIQAAALTWMNFEKIVPGIHARPGPGSELRMSMEGQPKLAP
jgi:hypothetical protein